MRVTSLQLLDILRPEDALTQLEGSDAAKPYGWPEVGIVPSVIAVGLLEVVRVDALRVAAAGDKLGLSVGLLSVTSHPCEADSLLGTVLGSDGPRGPSSAFLVEAPSPEQTAASWVELGGIVEILGKLWAFSRWEGVGRCVWVGDGMTPCRDSPAVGHPLGVSGDGGDGCGGVEK